MEFVVHKACFASFHPYDIIIFTWYLKLHLLKFLTSYSVFFTDSWHSDAAFHLSMPLAFMALKLHWCWPDRSISQYLYVYRMVCFWFRFLSPTITIVISLYHLYYNVLQTGWLYQLHFCFCSRHILIHSTLWFLKSERHILYRKIRDRDWGKKDLSVSFAPFLVLIHKNT